LIDIVFGHRCVVVGVGPRMSELPVGCLLDEHPSFSTSQSTSGHTADFFVCKSQLSKAVSSIIIIIIVDIASSPVVSFLFSLSLCVPFLFDILVALSFPYQQIEPNHGPSLLSVWNTAQRLDASLSLLESYNTGGLVDHWNLSFFDGSHLMSLDLAGGWLDFLVVWI
jgi:hypothetical protein